MTRTTAKAPTSTSLPPAKPRAARGGPELNELEAFPLNPGGTPHVGTSNTGGTNVGSSDPPKQPQKPTSVTPPPRAKAFFGSIDVNATTAKMKLVSVAEEIIALLAADPNATVKVTVKISAELPRPDQAGRDRERGSPRVQEHVLGVRPMPMTTTKPPAYANFPSGGLVE